MTAVIFALAAALGGGARYLLDASVKNRLSPTGPAGVLLANVLGSALLGVVTGLFDGDTIGYDEWSALAGFCGAFTTYSTAAVEVAYLFRGRRWALGLAYWLFMAVACIGVAWLGYVGAR